MNYFKNFGIVAIILLISCYSCGENPEENLKLFREIRNEMILNWNTKTELFTKIRHYFALRHIKYIEFKKDKIAIIKYQLDNGTDTRIWQKLDNKDINSTDIKNVLNLDSLNVNNLMYLKENLAGINVDNLWIIDYYDVIKGKYTKELDLRYTKSMNGLHFFYRIFQEPLNSMPSGSYNILTNNSTTGGILGDNIVWYYK